MLMFSIRLSFAIVSDALGFTSQIFRALAVSDFKGIRP